LEADTRQNPVLECGALYVIIRYHVEPVQRRPLLLRVFGRLPFTDVMRFSEAGVRKASREETAGGVCAGSGVGLWGFSAGVCPDLSVSNRDEG
jgi:hypothetical protein